MQRLSDSAAWVRFASELMAHTDLEYSEIAESADILLKYYQQRFPDPLTDESEDTH